MIKIYTQLSNRPKEFELLAEVDTYSEGQTLPSGWLDGCVDDMLSETDIIDKKFITDRREMTVDGEKAYVLVLDYESTDGVRPLFPIDDRIEFARYVTLVMTVSTRAVEQALDPEKPDLTADDIRNYTQAVRQLLDNIDGALE
jgi:hypothetical protein